MAARSAGKSHNDSSYISTSSTVTLERRKDANLLIGKDEARRYTAQVERRAALPSPNLHHGTPDGSGSAAEGAWEGFRPLDPTIKKMWMSREPQFMESRFSAAEWARRSPSSGAAGEPGGEAIR